MDMLTARESDIIARKTAVYLSEILKRPSTLYISESAAFDHYRQRNVEQWRKDGLVKRYERFNGKKKLYEYKVSDLDQLAAEIQYPFWKIKT